MNNLRVKASHEGSAIVTTDRPSDDGKTNPAILFIDSRHSIGSKEVTTSILNSIAKMVGYRNLYYAPWAELTRESVIAVINRLKPNEDDNGDQHQPLATATRNGYLSAMKGVAKEAYIDRQIDADMYERIRLIKAESVSRLPRGRALEVDEVSAALKACLDSGPAGIRNGAIIALLFGCGPRRAELVSIDIEDVCLQTGTIPVIGKGDKQRQLEMPITTQALLEKWISIRNTDSGPLFVRVDRWGNVGTERLCTDAVRSIVEKIARLAGLEKTTPHDMRRSFATFLLDSGEGLETVAAMLGHSDLNTTRIYDRSQERRNKAAAKKIVF